MLKEADSKAFWGRSTSRDTREHARHKPVQCPHTPYKRRVARLAFLSPNMANLAFFLNVWPRNFWDVLSSWPFFQVQAYLGLFSKSLFNKFKIWPILRQIVAFFSYKPLATLYKRPYAQTHTHRSWLGQQQAGHCARCLFHSVRGKKNVQKDFPARGLLVFAHKGREREGGKEKRETERRGKRKRERERERERGTICVAVYVKSL